MKFSVFADSRTGDRQHNEDRVGYLHRDRTLIMVIADGLGGHGHGELAAAAAVRSILAAFRRRASRPLDDPRAFLADAMAGAHTSIRAQRNLHQLHDPPRTTCVACVVQDGIACWAHAGDSRLYLLRQGRVLARTCDHSRASLLVEEGRLTEAEARVHPVRSSLTSCLGGNRMPRFEFSDSFALERGDVVLLCTDGVWSALADDTPLARLTLGDAVLAAPGLLDSVESAAGHHRDNLSLLLMVWGGATDTEE